MRSATRDRPGTISFRSCRRLPATSRPKFDSPVIFPPGPRNALDQFHSHRVWNEHEHDRDFCCGVPQVGRCNSPAHQDIDIQRYKFSGHTLEALRCLIRKPMLKLDVTPIDVAQPCKTFEQRVEVWDLLLWTTRMPEITNCGNFSALLRPRRERPRGRAAEQGQEFSSSDVACHVTPPVGVIHAMEG